MAEAIISRATYVPEQVDPTMSKFVMYLKASDGSPISGMKVQLNDAGEIYEYSTGSDGSTTIFPKSGWANINISNVFENGVIIVDQKVKEDNSWYNFEAPLGKKTSKDIVLNALNDNEVVNIPINIVGGMFFITNNIDVNLSGGGGGGGGGAAWYINPSSFWGEGGANGGGGYTNSSIGYLVDKYLSYNISVGNGGAGGAAFKGNSSGWGGSGSSGGTTIFNNIIANGGSGGSGGWARRNADTESKGTAAGGNGASGGRNGNFRGTAGGDGQNGWCYLTLHY